MTYEDTPPADTVWFVAAAGDYTRIHLGPGVNLLTRIPMSVLQDRWRDAGFVRIHRAYLVPLARVVDIRFLPAHRATVTVRSGSKAVELPVSRRRLTAIEDALLLAAIPNIPERTTA